MVEFDVVVGGAMMLVVLQQTKVQRIANISANMAYFQISLNPNFKAYQIGRLSIVLFPTHISTVAGC